MIPYSTPKFLITGIEPKLLEDTPTIRCDIAQNDLLVQKWIEDGVTVDVGSGSVSVFLTQEESGQFREGSLSIQLHGLMNDGTTAWKTYVMDVRVHKSLTEEVIS